MATHATPHHVDTAVWTHHAGGGVDLVLGDVGIVLAGSDINRCLGMQVRIANEMIRQARQIGHIHRTRRRKAGIQSAVAAAGHARRTAKRQAALAAAMSSVPS